jgi:hypothetical protein
MLNDAGQPVQLQWSEGVERMLMDYSERQKTCSPAVKEGQDVDKFS